MRAGAEPGRGGGGGIGYAWHGSGARTSYARYTVAIPLVRHFTVTGVVRLDLAFDPFGKPLDSLNARDLSRLRDVTEGWYVEYKRELPNAKAIAKSISSFANTYGGWLFVGVEECSKDHPVAGAFPGIPEENLESALHSVRQALASCLSDAPYIQIHSIQHHDDFPDLLPGRIVICIHVPRSLQAPFVHSSGQIYRRVADGSEPKPETDRHLLNQLFNRGKGVEREIRRWVKREPEFSKAEAKAPYIRLLFFPDIWREESPWLASSLGEVREIFREDQNEFISLPFNSVHPTHRGFVARQIARDFPDRLGLTWNLTRHLVSEVIIPVGLYKGELHEIRPHLPQYSHANSFITELKTKGFNQVAVVDLNFLFHVMCGIANKYESILEKAKWEKGFSFKAIVLNCWRVTPFLDTDNFISDVSKHGPFISLTKDMTVPAGTDINSFTFLERDFSTSSDSKSRCISTALAMFLPVAQAFGIPIADDNGKPLDIAGVLQAGTRAIKLQAAVNPR